MVTKVSVRDNNAVTVTTRTRRRRRRRRRPQQKTTWTSTPGRHRALTTSWRRSWSATPYRANTHGHRYAGTGSRKEVQTQTAASYGIHVRTLTSIAVLGDQGRSFKRIFALAQEQLRLVWGMELRELPVREKVTLQEKRKGTSTCTASLVNIHMLTPRVVRVS